MYKLQLIFQVKLQSPYKYMKQRSGPFETLFLIEDHWTIRKNNTAMDSGRYNTHRFRIGAATSAKTANIPDGPMEE